MPTLIHAIAAGEQGNQSESCSNVAGSLVGSGSTGVRASGGLHGQEQSRKLIRTLPVERGFHKNRLSGMLVEHPEGLVSAIE